ncbi:hypothetical protein M1512_03475 [Patescibacteria group bacterium]|jgi:phosphatidylethanolamine-binding protein (PEBP) family uncharacterized protein|nr:hypothetical protein [Patescibacteria group bacterium]
MIHNAVNDPDGTGKIFDHRVLFNIASSAENVLENSEPKDTVVGLIWRRHQLPYHCGTA